MTTGPTNSHSRPSAFTLLELILVLVLISVLLALASPSLRNFARARTTADAAARVQAMTQLARSKAICEGRLYRLCMDTEGSAFWLETQTSGAFPAPASGIARRFTLPEAVSAAATEGFQEADPSRYIRFYPDGRCDVASIEISDRYGNTYRVACVSAVEQFAVLSGATEDGS